MLNKFIITIALLMPVCATACSHKADQTQTTDNIEQSRDTVSTVATLQLPPLPDKPSGTAFIVVSKHDMTLSVYDRNAAGDTVIVAQFPCCMGKNKGNKQRRGDMRTPPGHKGIGIHGSTNNEHTVPGRASEGCIRLLDKDIITLKEHFAYVGMPVTVQHEDQAPFDWELRARQARTK